jgi:hypothetical protein
MQLQFIAWLIGPTVSSLESENEDPEWLNR